MFCLSLTHTQDIYMQATFSIVNIQFNQHHSFSIVVFLCEHALDGCILPCSPLFSIHLSFCQTTNQPTNQSINQSINPSIDLTIYYSVYQSIHRFLSIYLSIYDQIRAPYHYSCSNYHYDSAAQRPCETKLN